MLIEQAKTKKGRIKANKLWTEFYYKNGHKNITINNFLELGYTFCHYKIEKRYYQGYFTQQEIDNIFEVLNYYEGKILGLAG